MPYVIQFFFFQITLSTDTTVNLHGTILQTTVQTCYASR